MAMQQDILTSIAEILHTLETTMKALVTTTNPEVPAYILPLIRPSLLQDSARTDLALRRCETARNRYL